jgi:UDP-glucose 4-epimerase
LRGGEQTLTLGGTGAEVRDWTDVRDVARLLETIARQTQPASFQVINGGSGVGTTVAEIAQMLTKAWGDKIELQFSGLVRAGDPFSLVADEAEMRALPFIWEIPVPKGLLDYVTWFKDQVR